MTNNWTQFDEWLDGAEVSPGWCICGDPEEVCRSYNHGKSCLDKERERLDIDLSSATQGR